MRNLSVTRPFAPHALLLALCSVATPLQAPFANTELVALGTPTGVGARALSLGEAFTAVADDYSALYYNPAGLSQLTRSEVAINLSYQYLENLTALPGVPGNQGRKSTAENTRLNALTLVLAGNGPWAIALGYSSPISFDDPLGYSARGSDYSYNAHGQLDQYRLGFAYSVSEALRLGVAVSSLSGTEQLEITDGSTERYLEEYSGFNIEPAVHIHFSEAVSFGASAVVIENLQLTDTWQRQGAAPIETHYDIRHPFQTKMGWSFQSGLTQISLDWHAWFWSSNAYTPVGSVFEQGNFEYPNRHTFALGLEQHLAKRGPAFRLGVQRVISDNGLTSTATANPWRMHLGLGFNPARELALDVGYQISGSDSWQNSTSGGATDLNIKSSTHQVMASMRYRW